MKFLRWARPLAAFCVATATAGMLASCGGGYTIDYLYVISTGASGSTSGQISVFAVNSLYGGLSVTGNGNTSSGGASPSAVVATHDGLSLFVANKGSGNVAGFGISQGDGTLSSPQTVTTPGGSPVALATDTAADFLYVLDNAVPTGTPAGYGGVLSAYKVASGGGLTLVNSSLVAASSPAGVATTTDGSLVFVTAESGSNSGVVLSYTSSSGTLAATSSISAGALPTGIVVEPTNRFVYTTDTGGNQILSYGIGNNGALSPLISGGLPTLALAPVAITIEPRGRYVYVANANSSKVTGYSIQLSNGALNSLGTVVTETTPVAITVDPLEGLYVYTANYQDSSVNAYKITTSTGQLKGVQNSPFTNVGNTPTGVAAAPKGSAPIPGQP